jgi:hypothetical protein
MKIIGKIVGVQGARDGVNSQGHEWHQRQYVVEDETHPGEGVVVTTFSMSVMQQVGRQTNGQLTVEVEYTPKIRWWDGSRRDGTRGEAHWNQTLELTGFRILRGTPANAQEQSQAPQAQVQQAPVQQAYVAPAPQPQVQAQYSTDEETLPF